MIGKKEILDILLRYNFSKREFIILSGASMVLQGLKEETKDIDIAVSPSLYKLILETHDCEFEKIDQESQYDVYYLGDIVNFSIHYYYETEYDFYNDYQVQSIKSILEFKQNLNRKKDEKDMKLIYKYLKY